ncbi:MAG: hypothetical protein KDI90_01865 [Alphaproteobacteria bacterium]|nr:hypothetical protein [Alphaproteobacteria bacterium]MCB9975203.1 hypothetical protein [Rhodospirillales bacterium]
MSWFGYAVKAEKLQVLENQKRNIAPNNQAKRKFYNLLKEISKQSFFLHSSKKFYYSGVATDATENGFIMTTGIFPLKRGGDGQVNNA